MSTIQDLQQVQARRQEILDGDAARVEKQKKSGKLTARERVAKLLDDKSFVELDVLVSHDGKAEGVVTGYGTVEGRPVYVLSQDYTVLGGSVGEKHARKIAKVLDLARKTGSPVVLMCDSAGARIDEGATALEAYADIFARMARMSGVTPMIAMVLGPCVGAAALMSEMSDLTVMVKGVGAKLCAGPQVVSAVNGVNKTAEELGGAQAMLQQGGADFACESEQEAFETVRKALALLPSNNMEDAPLEAAEELNRACVGLEAGVDAKTLLAQLCDAGSVLELGAGYTKAVTALARMGGRAVAVVHTGGGEICAKRAQKIARFVRFADCYSLPVVTLIDTDALSQSVLAAQGRGADALRLCRGDDRQARRGHGQGDRRSVRRAGRTRQRGRRVRLAGQRHRADDRRGRCDGAVRRRAARVQGRSQGGARRDCGAL